MIEKARNNIPAARSPFTALGKAIWRLVCACAVAGRQRTPLNSITMRIGDF